MTSTPHLFPSVGLLLATSKGERQKAVAKAVARGERGNAAALREVVRTRCHPAV